MLRTANYHFLNYVEKLLTVTAPHFLMLSKCSALLPLQRLLDDPDFRPDVASFQQQLQRALPKL